MTPNWTARIAHSLDAAEALDAWLSALTTQPLALETLEEIRAVPGGIELYFHPGAPPLRVSVGEEGMTLNCDTLLMGRGYHAHLNDVVDGACELAGMTMSERPKEFDVSAAAERWAQSLTPGGDRGIFGLQLLERPLAGPLRDAGSMNLEEDRALVESWVRRGAASSPAGLHAALPRAAA